MTDIQAIKERAEKAKKAELDIETVYNYYVVGFPMLLKALAEARRKAKNNARSVRRARQQRDLAIERGVGMYNKVKESLPIMQTFAWCADEAAKETHALRSHTGEAASVLSAVAEKAGLDVLGYDLYERALSSAAILGGSE